MFARILERRGWRERAESIEQSRQGTAHEHLNSAPEVNWYHASYQYTLLPTPLVLCVSGWYVLNTADGERCRLVCESSEWRAETDGNIESRRTAKMYTNTQTHT